MSVELLDTPRFHGYRVRRQINGKTYQEYFSLKEDGKRIRGSKRSSIKKQADARDTELARSQMGAKEKAAREVYVDDKGRVRGILFRMKTEKSGTKTPVFQIGIMSTLESKIVNTTVSINLHGLNGAWGKGSRVLRQAQEDQSQVRVVQAADEGQAFEQRSAETDEKPAASRLIA